MDLLETGESELVCQGPACFFSTSATPSRLLSVAKDQVTAAQQWIKRRHISLKVDGGGRIRATAESFLLLEVNGQASIALQVLYEDFVPEEGLHRALKVLKAIVPLDKVTQSIRVNPLSVPLADQEYLLGSIDPSGLVVPVYVLGRKTFLGQGTFYFVVQARDLLDEKIQKGTLYLVPANRLREALSPDEYGATLREALNGKISRDRVRFQQQVLMPWTHRFIHFKSADDPDFTWESGVFARRATQVLVLLGAEPDSDERFAVNPSTCADFLYKPSTD